MLNRLLRPAAALALALVLGLALPRALALAPPAQELPPSQTGDAALQSAMIGGGGSLGGSPPLPVRMGSSRRFGRHMQGELP